MTNKTSFDKTRFTFFSLFFGLTGTHFIWQRGLSRGVFLTILTWSFFVLCLPFFSGRPIITTGILKIFNRGRLPSIWILQPRPVRWLFAIVINILSVLAAPYIYLTSVTTFLLYRIISNPWPYWMIIFACALGGGFYSAKYLSARIALALIGFATFAYISYFELVVFFFAQTC